MLNVEEFLHHRYPGFFDRSPLLASQLSRLLRLVFHEKRFRQFQQTYPHVQGFDFVEQVLAHFQFSYTTRDHERERIPVRGRVIIAANHPIGSVDGLALLKLIREIRPDVKVMANDMLTALKPLQPVLLPVDNMGGNTHRQQLEAIRQHLKAEGALIVFPAGEVSRLGPKGVRDGKWRTGFLRLATSHHAPVLPVFIDGRNSAFFYAVSLLARPLSTLWLAREMFKQTRHCLSIRIGESVASDSYRQVGVPLREKAQLFRRHIYRIGYDREGIFSTEAAIGHPENRAELRHRIQDCELLGETGDGIRIHLFRYRPDSVVMREIGRLREAAFRAVGEGSGRRRDTDDYDRHYSHLVLWDDRELEIAGAYRLCDASGGHPLYSASLFEFQPAMNHYLAGGLELGRSFVQPRYWGRRHLDYLWHGIGAYLRRHPRYRYLFGPVSLSNRFPRPAQEVLVHFYSRHFPSLQHLASPTLPFTLAPTRRKELDSLFPGRNYQLEFTRLKRTLAHMNLSVPPLYKQYPEICDTGGVQFAGFNIDPAFGNCVDGLIILDTARLKAVKRARYIGH